MRADLPILIAAGLLLAAGCATGLITDGPADAPGPDAAPRDGSNDYTFPSDSSGYDASASDDATADDASDDGSADAGGDDASDAGLLACADGGLGGVGIPAATTATANGSYMSTPASAIDGDPNTGWNSGGYSGWLQLQFAAPVSVTGVRIAALSNPSTSETYQVAGYQGGSSTPIGSATRSVSPAMTVLTAIPVTPAAYDAIRITVNGQQSWVVIGEVSLLTAGCP